MSNFSVAESDGRDRIFEGQIVDVISKHGEASSTNAVQVSTRNFCQTNADTESGGSQITLKMIEPVWKHFSEVFMEMIITKLGRCGYPPFPV